MELNSIQFLVVAVSMLLASMVQGTETYLEGEGESAKLSNPLVFRAEYSGIAGVTGRQLTIVEDGQWKYEGFRTIRKRKAKPKLLAEGRLTPEELSSLAELLEQYEYFDFPETMGSAQKVNPQRYSLAFGTHKSVLDGYTTEVDQPLGSQLVEQTADKEGQDKQPHAFGEIVDSLERMTMQKKQANEPQ